MTMKIWRSRSFKSLLYSPHSSCRTIHAIQETWVTTTLPRSMFAIKEDAASLNVQKSIKKIHTPGKMSFLAWNIFSHITDMRCLRTSIKLLTTSSWKPKKSQTTSSLLIMPSCHWESFSWALSFKWFWSQILRGKFFKKTSSQVTNSSHWEWFSWFSWSSCSTPSKPVLKNLTSLAF